MSKVYLIIGASSDVGMEFIKQLNVIEKEAVFYAHYNSNINWIESIIETNSNRIIPVKANLLHEEDIQRLIDFILQEGNIPSVLVHLPAPKLDFIKLKDLKWEDCIEDVNIQVGSALKIVQAILPKMVKLQERTKVVFMLSENTVVNHPAKFSTKYTMSKYMLLGFMKSLVVEYEGKNVNINALSPSIIDTKLLNNIDRRMLEMTGITEKMLRPEDVVEHLIKLVSRESDDMYGENIYIPGKENC